ncbi:unnamed protein product [Phytophthora fragariaefolia]|uniref:Unnamed protein product n=1 Tax=Phytophthora fragariaefolia TaxID=1490495 RepID=A0A9W7CPH8_9STRA|nr:unnamed protein product [Phytophthora fragariaefolia]
MPNLHQKFIKAWERTQVELHGTYSIDRVVELAKYTRETSWLHIIVVLLVTPLPCLAITVVSDILPLDDPAEGVKANKMFQVRQFYSYLVMSFLCAQQFRTSVRALPYPNWNVARDTVIVSSLPVMTAVLYAFAVWIGFPVPFSIVIAMPVWVVIITVAMAIEWLKLIQQNPATGTMVFNTIKVWLCEVLLVVIYPPYYYVFTTLSKTGQILFASLLPVIKLVMRNIFTLTVVHLRDEMPEVVVFNSEVFNALFVSYCMQNSHSIGTTVMVTLALLCQLAMSLRDVHISVNRAEIIGRLVTDDFWDPCKFVAKSSIGSSRPSALQRADSLLLGNSSQGGKREGSIQVRSASNLQLELSKDGSKLDGQNLKFQSRGTLQLQPIGARIQPALDPIKWGPVKPKRDSRSMSGASLQYILEVRRLMYLTEFLVLIYYVGVFIPLIFSKCLLILYYFMILTTICMQQYTWLSCTVYTIAFITPSSLS